MCINGEIISLLCLTIVFQINLGFHRTLEIFKKSKNTKISVRM